MRPHQPGAAIHTLTVLCIPNAVRMPGGALPEHVQRDVQAQLTEWCRQELPPYQVPRVWRLQLEPLPRNAMGKVNKKQLKAAF